MIRMYPDNSTQFKTSKTLHQYIHGGRGIIKLEAPSGSHHIYLFQRPIDEAAFPDDVIFVFAVHEQQTKLYIGMIEQDKFRLTRNSRFLGDTDIVKGTHYIMKLAHNQQLLDSTPMKVSHMGICARCGRKLSSEKSILHGVGPKCMKRLSHAKTRI